MLLSEAKDIAAGIIDTLEPYCEIIVEGGSIRREEKNPGDVEIVCVPKTAKGQDDLFGHAEVLRDTGFCFQLRRLAIVKGNPDTGKYIRCTVPDEDETPIGIDVFCATKENWGAILAIRTGSADFSHYCLAKRAHKFGMKFQGGFLTHNGVNLRSEDEGQIFAQLKMPWIPPNERGLQKTIDTYGPKWHSPAT